jgi:hypothetical protein
VQSYFFVVAAVAMIYWQVLWDILTHIPEHQCPISTNGTYLKELLRGFNKMMCG